MATFHQIISQNLECPICLTLFNQPKSLSCSHTFCKDCLQLISQTQSDKEIITCPICRKGTPLPSGDVGKLETNIPLSLLVEEVKITSPTCIVCESAEKPPAVSYCQDCGKYMCKTCEKGHSLWKPLSNHKIVPMSEVLSGKVPLKRRRKCKEHPNDDEECFCTDCQEYVCLRCGMLAHLPAGHQIEAAAIHEQKLIENIKELKKGVKLKKTTFENNIDFIESKRNEIAFMMRKLNDDIDEAYEEYMQLLSAKREELKSQVKQWSEKFEKELQVLEAKGQQKISLMNAMEELVTNGMKVPLEKDALFAHDTLCENLKSFLGRNDPDSQSPRGVSESAKTIAFYRYKKINEPRLGELTKYTWDVKADLMLPRGKFMTCMTRAPDGKMAVGSSSRGIHFYSPNGELLQTVLKDVSVYGIGFLSDGRSVVRGGQHKILLYTPQWEKLDVTFETRRCRRGSSDGNLAVDKDDNIYVCCRESKTIQVFTRQGGKAVRDMTCDGYTPKQLFAFNTKGILLRADPSAVVCLDGNVKQNVLIEKKGRCAYPAVCRDDSVIVAWVKNTDFWTKHVSIDRYTRDLEHVCNLITDFRVQPLLMGYYFLQEFASGEIAFCTGHKLYIFDGNLFELS
ncbi:uncharacterized protein [Diadema setosum]|uniref:uncharacterized protein n=1 Tax=Diadema setosum TaxID=31175 RepID=UPI003B3A82E0